MRHLLICPELPPAHGGGIGTYAARMARLLAERGEVVHAVALGEPWRRGRVERHCSGRLVVHRIPWRPQFRAARELLGLPFQPKPFARQAALLAERLIREEGIDVIEAQEYQAPLYWLQVRRAMGRGPASSPPCVVHLHSPTVRIARHNEWSPTRDLRGTVRIERYTVRAADQVIAPSRELARWAEARYCLGADSVRVIPYPAPETTPLERSANTWARGTVCYVGRLELRKGVLEWLEAARDAAQEFPEQDFELIGGDSTMPGGGSVRKALLERVPPELRPRIRFPGPQPRSALPGFLRRARMAVVPSRWDNYPYACMEAMASGLPVLGTRTGGIAEMVTPGRNGWLADSANPEDLLAALRRALRTPPDELAAMGERAARDVARLCDPERVVREHLELRRSLLHRGRERLCRPPVRLPGTAGGPRSAAPSASRPPTSSVGATE